MNETVVGLFRTREQAEEAVRELKNKGFSEDEISVLAADQEKELKYRDANINLDRHNLTDGAAVGGALGGLAGLLAGAGTVLIPGLAPLIALGPLAATLTGIAAGGIAGGLIDFGIPEEEGRRYEDEVKSGFILVAVKAEEADADEAASVMHDKNAVEVKKHGDEMDYTYGDDGYRLG